jgi:hypothetical protein
MQNKKESNNRNCKMSENSEWFYMRVQIPWLYVYILSLPYARHVYNTIKLQKSYYITRVITRNCLYIYISKRIGFVMQLIKVTWQTRVDLPGIILYNQNVVTSNATIYHRRTVNILKLCARESRVLVVHEFRNSEMKLKTVAC